MTTTRKRTPRTPGQRVTRAAVEAWRAGDYAAVALELRLKPWECSPAWCGLWRGTRSEPCSAEEHRGCHRALELLDALEAADGDE